MIKRNLLVSLDEGLRRVLSRAFSLNVGMDWRGVLEATKFLRKIKPDDPAKYDYTLSRISIMGYCAKEPAKSKCSSRLLVNVCKSSTFTPQIKTAPLRGEERKIFEKFLEKFGRKFDDIKTEYPLGMYRADALIHKPSCETFIVEVEDELNYNAISQVLTYRYLYYRVHGKMAKPLIVCSRSKRSWKKLAKPSKE